jgi:hypothetical protein
MSLDAKHPDYTKFSPVWVKMRDTYDGEDRVKECGEAYLYPTSGMVLDGVANTNQPGYRAYQAYKRRAVFPEIVEEAVKAMIGVMHSKAPMIELPPQMESLLERATLTGESLELLLRRINEAQLTTGRIGLMLDLPTAPAASALPYIATYDAEKIINWDDGEQVEPSLQSLNLVVLDETEDERQSNLEWKRVEKYRVLVLGDAEKNETFGLYRQGEFREAKEFDEMALIEPKVRGNTLDQIPFIFINDSDLLSCPKKPPLLALANLALAIYRGEADYRQNLYMQAQDTPVINDDTLAQKVANGQGSEIRFGAGAAIVTGTAGKASYIGVSSTGLPEQRQALENDYRRASQKGGQLLDTTSREKESGEALQIRVAAQTSTLTQIALTGAEGLQGILRIAAQWIGADPMKVIITPNLDFADAGMTPKDFLDLMAAKEKGLPLSEESIHSRLKENEYTDKEFEAEALLLATERGRVFEDEEQ